MQIKNKKTFILFFLINFCLFSHSAYPDEFNISAIEVSVDKKNNIITASGEVVVTDKTGKVINADKVIYKKNDKLLITEGSVKIEDDQNNVLLTDRAVYDKIEDKITTYENSKLTIDKSYKLDSSKIFYNNKNKTISSDTNSILTDKDNNTILVDMFEYQLNKNLFSSVGSIKVTDVNKNKYFFKELYIDTKKNEMIGSDVSVILDQLSFGVSEENDPRFVSNDIFASKEKAYLTKGVFTICQKRDDKCPPWSIQANKILHDRIKKTIYYEHAILKVYDFPIFYFPKFFHPDPTVKRSSGFLPPLLSNGSGVGLGVGVPYFWAISHDKDLTFSPRLYSQENPIILNEYRQAFKNGSFILDTSYTSGYKETTSTKTKGSRSHIFSDLDFNLADDASYESNISLKLQRTSNDTYFRVHDINTALVDAENTDLKNEINYNFAKDDFSLNIFGAIYENLRIKDNSRYEYIFPNINLQKSFFTENLGLIDFKTNLLYRNYKVDKHLTSVENTFIWSPPDYYTSKGFVNKIEGMIMNTNYEARNTTDRKTDGVVNEFSGVLKYKSSLPMKKQKLNSSNIFSPTFMIRYAPGHMRKLNTENVLLNYTNLYSTNKTSVIEDGLSAVLGFDFDIMTKSEGNVEKEKLSLSLGQVFSPERNKNMPYKSSLDQKMSDVVGEMNYNFSDLSTLSYKFSVDHNLNDLNYSEIATTLNFGKLDFNINYLEEQNHIGNEHYVSSGVTLNLSKNNKLNFETKKNYKTESTEYYDMSYEYTNDCLTAGLLYRREFYEDSDVEQKDNLFFTITFKPFAGVRAPLQ